jgi:MFS family permease
MDVANKKNERTTGLYSPQAQRLRMTQFWDAGRAFFSGSHYPLRETVAMLVLIEFYHAGDALKTVFAVIVHLGMLFSVPVTGLFSNKGLRINYLVAAFNAAAMVSLLFAAASSHAVIFVLFASIPGIMYGLGTPCLVQLYGEYEKERRGSRFATSAMALFLGSAFFAFCAQLILKSDGSGFRLILLLYAAGFAAATLASLRLPAESLKGEAHANVLRSFRFLKQDPLFAYVCLAHFISGFAYLWLAPYRTNFLAEQRFGFGYAPWLVILLVVIIPDAVKLLSLRLFGALFDRVNFIALRMLISALYGAYAVLFFYGDSIGAQLVGVVLLGLAIAGTNVTWTLWVTKLAAPEKVASYMSVHTTLTGIRQVLGPFFGLWALTSLGPDTAALMSLAGFGVVVMMLIPLLKTGRTHFVR